MLSIALINPYFYTYSGVPGFYSGVLSIPSARFLTEEGSLVCREDCAFPHSELQVL